MDPNLASHSTFSTPFEIQIRSIKSNPDYESILVNGFVVRTKSLKGTWTYVVRYFFKGEDNPVYALAKNCSNLEKRRPKFTSGLTLSRIEYKLIDRDTPEQILEYKRNKNNDQWNDPKDVLPRPGVPIKVLRKDLETQWEQDTYFGGKKFLCNDNSPAPVLGWKYK